MSVPQLADKLRPKLIEAAWMLRDIPSAGDGQRSQILGAIEMIVRDVKHELEQPLRIDSTPNEFYSLVQPILDRVKSVEDLVSHARRTKSWDRFCNQDAQFLENCIGFIDGIQPDTVPADTSLKLSEIQDVIRKAQYKSPSKPTLRKMLPKSSGKCGSQAKTWRWNDAYAVLVEHYPDIPKNPTL